MNPKSDRAVPTERSKAALRPIAFADPAVTVDRRDDGTVYLRPRMALGEFPVRLTDRLHHWAGAEPDRVFMADGPVPSEIQRPTDGESVPRAAT